MRVIFRQQYLIFSIKMANVNYLSGAVAISSDVLSNRRTQALSKSRNCRTSPISVDAICMIGNRTQGKQVGLSIIKINNRKVIMFLTTTLVRTMCHCH